MPHIRINNQPVTQITVIEPEPGKQAEAPSLMTERARVYLHQPTSRPRRAIHRRNLGDFRPKGAGYH